MYHLKTSANQWFSKGKSVPPFVTNYWSAKFVHLGVESTWLYMNIYCRKIVIPSNLLTNFPDDNLHYIF